jgi:hypothetical protein
MLTPCVQCIIGQNASLLVLLLGLGIFYISNRSNGTMREEIQKANQVRSLP